jgi:hypothetical protein
LRGEFTRPARVGVAGERPRGERTRRVGEDRTGQATTLRAGCATTARIFFSVIIYSFDLFSKTDGGIASTNRSPWSRLGEQVCVAAISMNRFDDEICLRSAECAS